MPNERDRQHMAHRPLQPQRQQNTDPFLHSKDQLPLFKSDGSPNADAFDKHAEALAQQLQKIAPSQLRRFFNQVMRIRRRLAVDRDFAQNNEAIIAELALLKALCAYAASRFKWGENEAGLLKLFAQARNTVKNAQHFEVFARYFEAIVAFHKYYEPRKGN